MNIPAVGFHKRFQEWEAFPPENKQMENNKNKTHTLPHPSLYWDRVSPWQPTVSARAFS